MAMMGNSEFVLKLAKALGLPEHTRAFEIRCAVDEAVTIKCEYFPTLEPDEAGVVLVALKEYELHEKC